MANKNDFWEELCGSILMQKTGYKSVNKESLLQFDKAYFNFYPFLSSYLEKNIKKNSDTLEIGLGYGTTAQYFANVSKSYVGVDAANNSVKLINQRFKWFEITNSKAIVGDAKNLSNLNSESFDQIISFGCFHHTGDISKCINESYRLLRPNGKIIVMIYADTLFHRFFMHSSFFYKKYIKKNFSKDFESFKRYMFDSNVSGEGAPITSFTKKKDLKKLFKNFRSVEVDLKNHQLPFLRSKNLLLSSLATKVIGCDWYIIARK